jgi:hypothetical protein
MFSDIAIPKRLKVEHSKISAAWPGMMLVTRKISGLNLNRLYDDYPIIKVNERPIIAIRIIGTVLLYQAQH